MTVTVHGGHSAPADRVGRPAEPMAAELGPVGLYVHSLHGVPTVVHGAGRARRCDPERYRLSLITGETVRTAEGGSGGGPGGGRHSLNETDVLVLHDTWPHDTWPPLGSPALPGAGRGDIVMLHFPKAALPLRSPGLEHLPACRLPADAGMGAVLAQYLTSIASAVEKGEVGAREGARLGEVALDLTVMTLTPWVRAHDAGTPESRRQVLLGKIEAFIEHRLGDPDLTPTAIAGQHHISPAYLHRLFQNRELTVAAWIRHRRLESCRADLADPGLRLFPVHAIGVRWGFRGAAEFSRAFRAAYGTTPGDYRRQVLEREWTGVDGSARNR